MFVNRFFNTIFSFPVRFKLNNLFLIFPLKQSSLINIICHLPYIRLLVLVIKKRYHNFLILSKIITIYRNKIKIFLFLF